MKKKTSSTLLQNLWKRFKTANAFIKGFFIAAILFGLTALVLMSHMAFNISLPGFLLKEYHNGISIPVTFSQSVGSDTSVLVQERRRVDGSAPFSIFRNDAHGNPVQIVSGTPVNLSSKNIVYRDTIYPVYHTSSVKPPWNDAWAGITKIDFRKGAAYIQPHSFANRIVLLLPQVLFYLLLGYGCWQLALLLDNIYRNRMFTSQNHALLNRTGFAILFYQAILTTMYLLGKDFMIDIDYRSTIPNYRSPLTIMAEPDYHIGWEYVITACIILIIAKAFRTGYLLQKEQELTI